MKSESLTMSPSQRSNNVRVFLTVVWGVLSGIVFSGVGVLKLVVLLETGSVSGVYVLIIIGYTLSL